MTTIVEFVGIQRWKIGLASCKNPVIVSYVRITLIAIPLPKPQSGDIRMDQRVSNVGILNIDLEMSSQPKNTTKAIGRDNTLSLDSPNYSKQDVFSWTFVLLDSLKANHMVECGTNSRNFVLSERTCTNTRPMKLPNDDSKAELFNAGVNRYSRKEKDWSFFLGCWHE